MNTYQTVTLDKSEAIAVIRLNRPEELNSFNQQLCRDVTDALKSVAGDTTIRAVLLGAHGRVFSAGADLKTGMPLGSTVTQRLREEFKPGLMAIVEMDKPVISVVQGSAAGIGLAYALAADLVLMAETAFVLSPFANIGLIPDGGLNWLLPSMIGYQRAFQMAIECDRLPANKCLELGLINRVVPDSQLDDTALQWARTLVDRSPLAISLTKKAMRCASNLTFSQMIDLEADLQATCIDSQDFREGVTAFLQKRKPHFQGK